MKYKSSMENIVKDGIREMAKLLEIEGIFSIDENQHNKGLSDSYNKQVIALSRICKILSAL